VLELAPQLPEAHVNMGFALLGSGSTPGRAHFFDGATALKRRPGQRLLRPGPGLGSRRRPGDGHGAMRSYLHLARHDGEDHLRRARAALWEWESKRQAARPAAAAASTPGR
jgi:hypothetical protein